MVGGGGWVIKKSKSPFKKEKSHPHTYEWKIVKYKLYFHFEYLLNIDKKLREIM